MSPSRPDPDPVERLLDVAVFAPLGLALSVGDWLTKLADRGRQQVESQLPAARLVGEIAIREGRRRAERAITPLRQQVEETIATVVRPLWGADGKAGAQNGSDGGGAARGDTDAPRRAAPGPGGATAPEGARGAGPGAAELPIPGYDTLAASQVVQRLEGLSVTELEAVRAHEQAGRGRKTVLTRVAQLLSGT